MAPSEIICVGELLIDLISTEYTDDFRSADRYQRLPGGSPANLAMNLARLGQPVSLVATVGKDDAGTLLLDAVQDAGVNIATVARHEDPTTLILVTKSRAVSNFEPYRLADRQITLEQLKGLDMSAARILHTTAFALSQDPARSSILITMREAAARGIRLSTDFNYADKIWMDNVELGRKTLTELAGLGALVKVSEVDFERLFGEMVIDYHSAAKKIKDLGAHLVCLTLGEDGVFVMHDEGSFHLPAREVDVKDTTGAGDAFWSGFLAAYNEGSGWEYCARAGRTMAELKLSRVGPVLEKMSVQRLLEE